MAYIGMQDLGRTVEAVEFLRSGIEAIPERYFGSLWREKFSIIDIRPVSYSVLRMLKCKRPITNMQKSTEYSRNCSAYFYATLNLSKISSSATISPQLHHRNTQKHLEAEASLWNPTILLTERKSMHLLGLYTWDLRGGRKVWSHHVRYFHGQGETYGSRGRCTSLPVRPESNSCISDVLVIDRDL